MRSGLLMVGPMAILILRFGRSGGMADAPDSKSGLRK